MKPLIEIPRIRREAHMMTRRLMLGAIGAAVMARFVKSGAQAAEPAAHFEVEKTETEWRKQLSAAQYHVLREHGTERAGSSPLVNEHRKGVFKCAGCGLPLFSSETKFESGTGWPSFWSPLEGAVATTTDRSLLMVRTEVHCRRCGGHLGHVFDDGPRPTGLRYCMNGVVLTFSPASS
jgi:peptide-methionine (R)-S-oxide reductase